MIWSRPTLGSRGLILQFAVAQLVVLLNVEAVIVLFVISLEGFPAFVSHAVNDALSNKSIDEGVHTIGHRRIYTNLQRTAASPGTGHEASLQV